MKGSYKTNFYVIRMSFHGRHISMGLKLRAWTKIAGRGWGLMILINCPGDKNHAGRAFITMS